MIAGLLEHELHVTVLSVSDAEMTGRLSFFKQGEQDLCVATTDLPAAGWEEPSFAMPPTTVDLPFPTYESAIPVRDLALGGRFSADYGAVRAGAAQGEVDARDLGPYLEGQIEDTSPQYVCELLLGFGMTCGACAADGQPYCVPFDVEEIAGAEADTDAAECVALDNCHPGCAQSSCEDPDAGVCE